MTKLDLARIAEAPGEAVVGASSAGCEAVRIVLDGALAYVSARGSDAVLVLDPARFADRMTSLAEAPARAVVRRYPVGAQPVGIAVVGQRLVVANSHRWSGGTAADVEVLDTVSGRILATLPAAEFPREIAVSPHGSTVVVGSYLGQALEVIDLEHVPFTP